MADLNNRFSFGGFEFLRETTNYVSEVAGRRLGFGRLLFPRKL